MGTRHEPANGLAHWREFVAASHHNATLTSNPTPEINARWLEQADAEWALKLAGEETQQDKEPVARLESERMAGEKAQEDTPLGEGQESRERELSFPYQDGIEAAAREIARQAVTPPPCAGPPLCCLPTKRACQNVARQLKAEGIVPTIKLGTKELYRLASKYAPEVLASAKEEYDSPEAKMQRLERKRQERERMRELERRHRIRQQRAQRRCVAKSEWERMKDLIYAKTDQVVVDDSRGARLRALEIPYEREVVEWDGSKYGRRPVLGRYIIPRKYVVRFLLDKKRRDRKAKQRLERLSARDPVAESRRKKEIQRAHSLGLPVAEFRTLSEEQRGELAAKRAWQQQRDRHNELCQALIEHADSRFALIAIRSQIKVLIGYGELGLTATRELHDLREAHPQWLDSALSAAKTNISREGRAYEWYSNGDIGFYEFLRIARKVQWRHEETDYEYLLARGHEKETARDLMIGMDYDEEE